MLSTECTRALSESVALECERLHCLLQDITLHNNSDSPLYDMLTTHAPRLWSNTVWDIVLMCGYTPLRCMTCGSLAVATRWNWNKKVEFRCPHSVVLDGLHEFHLPFAAVHRMNMDYVNSELRRLSKRSRFLLASVVRDPLHPRAGIAAIKPERLQLIGLTDDDIALLAPTCSVI